MDHLVAAARTMERGGVSPVASGVLSGLLLVNLIWIGLTPVTGKWDDFASFAVFYAPFIGVAALCLRWRAPMLAACIASVLFMLMSTNIIGLNAMLGLTAARPLIDRELAAIDAVLRIDHLAIAAWASEHRQIASFLASFYNASGPLVLLTALLLAVTGRFAHLSRYWLIYVGCGAVTCLVAALWPAVGTYVHYGIPPLTGPDMPQGVAGTFHLVAFEQLRSGGPAMLGPFDVQGVVTFPSFHCVMALVIAYGLWPFRWLRWAGVFAAVVTIIATIPIGGHYVIDVIAGAALFAAMRAAARMPERRVETQPRLQPAE